MLKNRNFMEQRNPFRTSFTEPFITGCDNLSLLYDRLCKTESFVILLCRQGNARVMIDLHVYDILPYTVMFLLPSHIVNLISVGKDFQMAYFACSEAMFREASFRFDPRFFHFIKENPCKVFPSPHREAVEGLMNVTATVYADLNNRFRYEIAKNLLQVWLMDLYDKTHRWFTPQDMEGHNRQEELLKKFISLIHTHCASEREAGFYANTLCISTKYLTDICTAITGKSAKKLIDEFVLLEIKVLLQNTEFSIQEITNRLNFPDQSYLGRYFKRQMGISPSTYREKFIK